MGPMLSDLMGSGKSGRQGKENPFPLSALRSHADRSESGFRGDGQLQILLPPRCIRRRH